MPYKITPVPQPELSTARVWDVTGGTAPYVVKCSSANEWCCSCADYVHRGRSRGACKHVVMVKDLEDTATPRLFE